VNLASSKKETKQQGGTFYEKVNDAERGQLDEENRGKRPLSPTLAPSPPASPILKPAAAAR